MATLRNRNDILLQATIPRVDTVGIVVDYGDLTDVGGTKPDDNADVTANNTSNNTNNVGSSTAADVNDVIVNFDGRNDRDASIVVAPTILTNGNAIDHTINTDGSADISFEWQWTGVESDIDGFFVGVRSSTSSSSYTFGTTSSEEIIIQVPSDRRAHGFTGVAADKYSTFFIRAFRVVDNDINSNNILLSSAVQPSLSTENPYQPSSGVAFSGDLTGTIQGSAAGSLANQDNVDYSSDVTGTKPPSNATAGADYNSNVSNRPVSLNDINSSEFDVIASQNSNSFIAGNLIPNGNMSLVAPDGRPLGVKACYGGSDPGVILYQNLAKTILNIYSVSDDTIGAGFPAFRIGKDTTYTVFIRFKSNVASSSGFYITIEELNSELDIGNTHVSQFERETGVQAGDVTKDIGFSDQPITTVWQTVELTYTPNNAAVWASLVILNWSPMGLSELHIDRAVIYSDSTKGSTWDLDIKDQPSDTVLLNVNTTPADIGYTGDLDANKSPFTYAQTTAPTVGLIIGDLWIDTNDSNKLYRYNGSSFVALQDADIQQSLADASTAQATADGKIITFYQSSIPVGTLGDLWIDTDDGNKLYRHNGSSFIAVQDADITTALTNASSASSAASNAQSTADSKIVTFYQTTNPTGQDVGDLWFSSSTKLLKRWDGSVWQDTANIVTQTSELTDDAGLAGADYNTNVANKPASLNDINSIEGNKLTGIATGAQVNDYVDSRIANTNVENLLLTITKPLGASYSNNSTGQTGVIKITLPQTWTNTMLKFTVDVYLYESGKSFSLEIGGYNFSVTARWLNTTANLSGSTASDNRVRFGHDGTNCAIYIGETSSVWEIPKILVRNFQAGFSNFSAAQWDSGWAISIESTVGTISPGEDYSNTLIDANAIKNQGTLATKSSVDLATTDVANKSLANVDGTANTKLNGIATGADVTSANTAMNVTGQTGFATLNQINSGNIGTYIANLAILNAQIANAQISTLKIQGEAVTIPITVQGAATTSLGIAFAVVNLATAIITVPSGIGSIRVHVLATSHAAGQFYDPGSNITWKWRNKYFVTRGGSNVGVEITQITDQVVISFSELLPAGTYTYIFKGQNVTFFNPFIPVTLIPSITLTGVKK